MPKKQNGQQHCGNQMDDIDIQTNIIIPGIKLKFLSIENEYGTSQLFPSIG